MNVHLRDSQTEDFQCPYLDCSKKYKYKKNLTFHIKTFHEKTFSYVKCTHEGCETTLNSKKNLKQHVKIVHGEKVQQKVTEKKDKT